MKRFFLMMIITIAVLYTVIFVLHLLFDFQLINVAFIVGVIASFATYSGGSRTLGEALAARNSLGNYVPKRVDPEKYISPLFIGSVITALTSFLFLL